MVFLAAPSGCSGSVQPDSSTGDSAPPEDTANTTCGAALPDQVRLEVEAYNWGSTDNPWRRPGRLRTWIARSETELSDWMFSEVAYEGATGSFDWATEAALVGYLDTTSGLPSAFSLTGVDGLGTDVLNTAWCVEWPETVFDESSRVVRVYAIPTGTYTTIDKQLSWEGH
ncbi:MAG: hypothetical protein Q8P41_28580 [Pseudomonadota bacterium]|nr:hypothetical protein [Pseudomonadota bacterium]